MEGCCEKSRGEAQLFVLLTSIPGGMGTHQDLKSAGHG